jgi:ATP-dependent Clp protease ATP-binding subunit ClpB
MTSNLGAEIWGDPDQSETVAEGRVRQLLTGHFRPEFLNRLDEIVVFHRLTKDHLKEIVEIQLKRAERRIAEQGYAFEITEGAKAYLAEVGYDPVYGARPLKRAIQRELQDPLAMQLLSGDFRPGDTIRVEKGPQGLTFRAVSQAEMVRGPA